MAIKRKKLKKRGSILQGRPPLAKRHHTSLSSKATRTLIRSHHDLKKALEKALKVGDNSRACDLEAEIAARGGLAKYQLASIQGQSVERGGDSSRQLVKWLKPVFDEAHSSAQRLRLLEIGALSTKNACSRMTCVDIKRIDLRSKETGIEEIDFMEMSVPPDSQRFQIISLSLVLNYVPNPASRGAMLARLPLFLENSSNRSMGSYLFLVLPLACVANSRYMTEERLSHIMHALGFRLLKQKTSRKLYYSLWTFEPAENSVSCLQIPKEELRSGVSRNNFAITLCSNDQNDSLKIPKKK